MFTFYLPDVFWEGRYGFALIDNDPPLRHPARTLRTLKDIKDIKIQTIPETKWSLWSVNYFFRKAAASFSFGNAFV